MKKFPLFLSLNSLLVSLAFLGACSNAQKIDLMYGDLTKDSVTSIHYNTLKEKVDSKDTFLLAVQYSDGCACWNSEAKPVLEKYIKEKHVEIFHIKLEELDANNNRFGLTIITGNVSFAIFEDGEVKHCVTTKDDSTLKKYDEFTSYFESIVTLPRIYNVSLDDIDRLYHKSEKNIVYYSRSTCGDCSYINTHFLKEWSKANPNYKKNIYMLDCDQPDIRYDDEGNYNEEQWFQFKHDYGMSNKHNPTYGYDGGYVPTFLLIEGSSIGVTYLSGAVAFNDTVTKEDGKYVISNTYYSKERVSKLAYIDEASDPKYLEGLTLSSEDVTIYEEYNYIAWNHESSEKYHNVYLDKFLKYAEKQ